jgi:N-acetylmuramoyl-L-alanine amidase
METMINFSKPKRIIDRIVLHCSASDVSAHDDISVITAWHKERNIIPVGYHYFIKRSGDIQQGRDIELPAEANPPHNRFSIAICLHGLKTFTDEQFMSLRQLVWIILRDIHVPIQGHCEINPNKTCPCFDYRKVLSLDEKGYETDSVV